MPIATLLTVPLILTDTVHRHAGAGSIRLLVLFIQIQVIWCILWMFELIASCLPIVLQAV